MRVVFLMSRLGLVVSLLILGGCASTGSNLVTESVSSRDPILQDADSTFVVGSSQEAGIGSLFEMVQPALEIRAREILVARGLVHDDQRPTLAVDVEANLGKNPYYYFPRVDVRVYKITWDNGSVTGGTIVWQGYAQRRVSTSHVLSYYEPLLEQVLRRYPN